MSTPIGLITGFLDEELDIESFDDDSQNGLQVEGRKQVARIGLGVDASLGTFEMALDRGCDLIAVHHGLFWSKGMLRLTGTNYKRVSFIKNDLALYASHLPLDAHPKLGNNAGLARVLGLQDPKPYARYHGKDIGMIGDLPEATTAGEIAQRLSAELGKASGASGTAGVIGDATKEVKRIGVVSGGGTLAIGETLSAGADVLVTGEGPHHANLDAIDSGMTVIYGGHYETETLGVKALGPLLEEKFGVETVFLDVGSPGQ